MVILIIPVVFLMTQKGFFKHKLRKKKIKLCWKYMGSFSHEKLILSKGLPLY